MKSDLYAKVVFKDEASANVAFEPIKKILEDVHNMILENYHRSSLSKGKIEFVRNSNPELYDSLDVAMFSYSELRNRIIVPPLKEICIFVDDENVCFRAKVWSDTNWDNLLEAIKKKTNAQSAKWLNADNVGVNYFSML